MDSQKRTRQFPTVISTTQFVKLYIMHLLTERTRYGQDMMDEIEQRLNGRWKPSPGMLYPLLSQLESEGYIKGEWSEPEKRSVKRYRLTDTGIAHYKVIKLQYKSNFLYAKEIINNTMADLYPR